MTNSSSLPKGSVRPVSRRAVLLGSGGMLALGAASSFVSAPTAAFAAQAGPAAIALVGTDNTYFTTEHTVAVPWKLPTVLAVQATGQGLRGAKIAITWDARLASATSTTVVVANDTEIAIVEASVSAGKLEFAWPAGLEATNVRTDYQCVLPIRKTELFPLDSLSDVQATEAVVDLRNGGAPLRAIAIAGAVVSQGLAWGASLSVLWGPQGLDTAAVFPRVIRVESVGPGPIPAQAAVDIAVDASKVTTLQLVSVLANSDESKHLPASTVSAANAGMNSLRVTLAEALAAGSALRINFEGALTLGMAQGAPATAVVTFMAPPGTSAMQRYTMSETVTLGQ